MPDQQPHCVGDIYGQCCTAMVAEVGKTLTLVGLDTLKIMHGCPFYLLLYNA